MEKRLLKQGRIWLGQQKGWLQGDLLIVHGRIAKIAPQIDDNEAEVIDVLDQIVIPGLIDMHVHLREPGFTEKETILTGTKAAARGGFTTVACMPNTKPITDSPEIVRQVIQQAEQAGFARVLPLGAITVGEKGQSLTDMAALKEAGIVAVSDDGVGVQSSLMMKEAMREAVRHGLPVVAHCEDESILQPGACVHAGVFAQKHNLVGIPSEAESIHIARDILLAEDVGVHYHVCHISSEQSVRLVREAKERGQKVTAEVTPHHLLLCDEEIPGLDTHYKMNPPLRSQRDREALLNGLIDGTIDIIATDHAPHTQAEKEWPIDQAPFGIVGLETAFPLLYTYLVKKGILSLEQLIDKLTAIPAALFQLTGGQLVEGAAADITVIDLQTERTIQADDFLSKGRNTPFSGWKAAGWPLLTFLNGRITWDGR